jgi:hypothetical protein
MIDWLSSMQQSFEYYTVDPSTWKDVKRIENVLSCTIDRDSEVATLGSANISLAETIGESYIRVYLVVNQNGNTYKEPLGTFLVQTPTWKFNGKTRDISIDAYTPLLELKENLPPIGYSLLKDENIMNAAYRLCRERVRAPVVEAACSTTLHDDFVANTDDTWLTFLTDLIANAKYTFGLDELGRVIFLPIQDAASLQPVWTYTDDNSSILYPDINLDRDLYGIPNVVEVVYSSGNDTYHARVVNDDPNSPISTVRRGREIVHRVTNPDLYGDPTENQTQEYAERLLRKLSTLECAVTYSHGYCPVRLNDCVRLNYTRSGITDIKAKVISQSINCSAGCKVTETAVYTTKLWR